MSAFSMGLWKFHFILNEITLLLSSMHVEFLHILRSKNTMANALVKEMIDCLSAIIFLLFVRFAFGWYKSYIPIHFFLLLANFFFLLFSSN